MKFNKLLEIVNKAYPDDCIADCWDPVFRQVQNSPHGDGLALFIIHELLDTYDKDTTDSKQLMNALDAMIKTVNELKEVCNALIEADCE